MQRRLDANYYTKNEVASLRNESLKLNYIQSFINKGKNFDFEIIRDLNTAAKSIK